MELSSWNFPREGGVITSPPPPGECPTGAFFFSLPVRNGDFSTELNFRENTAYMYSVLIHGKTRNSDWKIKWFAPFCMESFRNYGLWFVFLCKRFPPRWYGKHARYFPGNVFLLLFVSLSFCFQHSYHKVMQCLWWGLCSCSNHWQFNTVHQAYSDVICHDWFVE